LQWNQAALPSGSIFAQVRKLSRKGLLFTKGVRDFTVIGAILDRGQKSERKQYGADFNEGAI
jgi:hypothetical protein